MGTYRLLRGSYGMVVDGKNRIVKPGPKSYLELTAEQAGRLKDCNGSRVEPVDLGALQEQADANAAKKAGVGTPSETVQEKVETLVQDLNVEGAVEFIKAIEEEAVLDAVEAEEAAETGKQRKGVFDAVAAVRAEFNDDENED